MSSIRRSLALSFAQRYAGMLVQTAATMIIARVLTPKEFGIFSVAAAAVGLAGVLRDFGVGRYIVQETELTRARLRAAFTLMLLFAWAIGAILFVGRGAVADFYKQPDLSPIVAVLALNFFVLPFGSPIMALLQREMEFGALLVINTVSIVLASTASITLALLGFGPVSLAWGMVVGTLGRAAVAHLHRPGSAILMPSLREFRHVTTFGAQSTMQSLIAEIGHAAPELLIGRLLGFVAVGNYGRAVTFTEMFNRAVLLPIGSVITPAYAKLNRDRTDLRTPYLLSLAHLTAFSLPFYTFVVLMAFPLIRILFGPQWDAAVPILQLIAVSAATGSVSSLNGSILIAIGEVRTALRLEFILMPIRLGLVVVAVFHSLEAVGLALIGAAAARYVIQSWAVRRFFGVGHGDIALACWRSVVLAAFCAVPPVAVNHLTIVGPNNIWVPTLLAAAGTGAAWLASVFALGHPVSREVNRFLGEFRRLAIVRRASPNI